MPNTKYIIFDRILDGTAIHDFRRLLEKHHFIAHLMNSINAKIKDMWLLQKVSTMVNATNIHALPSIMNEQKQCDYYHRTMD